MSDDYSVVHDAARNRFEVRIGAELCHLDYRLADGTLTILHTEVPPSLGGRGIAGGLVAAAIEYARANHLRVRPSCSYARAWMERHPQSQDLLPPGYALG
jgi:uncharacterized protein